MNRSSVHVAVDVTGGDHGTSITLPAALQSLAEHPTLTVTLFAPAEHFHRQDMLPFKALGERVRLVETSNDVSMDDKPSHALRHKQQSSMYQAVSLVSRGEADACVSAGNTGALMAMGRFLVQTFPGIDRPAACAEMPTEQGRCLLLDLGANVDCNVHHLEQFAVMGSEMAKVVFAFARPRVALLNIGEEQGKGNVQVHQAAERLAQNAQINYTGFAEGNDIFNGKADVVVCDGFVGNAVLKASEGVARLIALRLAPALSASALKTINPSRYNGASLLGLRRTVVASHGNTDVEGFAQAMRLAILQASMDLPNKIQQQLAVA